MIKQIGEFANKRIDQTPVGTYRSTTTHITLIPAVMASAVTTTSTTASSACASKLYDIPVQDASCALPYRGNHTDIMAACCGSASVIAYYDNCGLFCLAQGQTVHELTECLFAHGAPYSKVFCSGNTTAEATGMATVAASATAHVVATAQTATSSPSTPNAQSSFSSSSSSSAARTGDRFGAVRFSLALGLLALLFGCLL